MSSWDRGYGDMEFALDLETIRLLQHQPATAMVQCDLVWLDHSPVVQSPRTILKTQLAAAAEAGYVALAGTELEFIAFNTTYEEAWNSHYRDLVPVNQYNVDYSILGGSRAEPLLREIRNRMYAAGMNVESAKGECNFGQHEIGFLYAEALTTADNHAVYKTAAKQIAAQQGKAITFMAKYNEREGNSCHIHLSLRGEDGSTVFWGPSKQAQGTSRQAQGTALRQAQGTIPETRVLSLSKDGRRSTTRSSPACWPRWRTSPCSMRRTSTPTSVLRPDRSPHHHRVGPGQPDLCHSAGREGAVGAAGESGPRGRRQSVSGAGGDAGRRAVRDRAGSRAGPELTGNAYTSGLPAVPRTLRDARDAFHGSEIARACFGDEVVDHYTNMADVELAAFDAAVTDWELRRSFERM